jgi:hypothetical protein
MKKLFVLTGFLFLCAYSFGQAQDGTVELQKTFPYQPAALIYLPYSPEVVQKALSNYLSKTSNKEQENAKGYLLSSNTLIVNNNKSGADMHFVVGLKAPGNINESVIYLKLNSFSNSTYENGVQRDIQFNMQDAKDYLDNLAIAIEPYASKLQLELQQKNLANAEDKNTSLIKEGDRLEQKRKKIHIRTGENENYKRDNAIARKKVRNDKAIDENLTARVNLTNDIAKQMTSLALLKN